MAAPEPKRPRASSTSDNKPSDEEQQRKDLEIIKTSMNPYKFVDALLVLNDLIFESGKNWPDSMDALQLLRARNAESKEAHIMLCKVFVTLLCMHCECVPFSLYQIMTVIGETVGPEVPMQQPSTNTTVNRRKVEVEHEYAVLDEVIRRGEGNATELSREIERLPRMIRSRGGNRCPGIDFRTKCYTNMVERMQATDRKARSRLIF